MSYFCFEFTTLLESNQQSYLFLTKKTPKKYYDVLNFVLTLGDESAFSEASGNW